MQDLGIISLLYFKYVTDVGSKHILKNLNSSMNHRIISLCKGSVVYDWDILPVLRSLKLLNLKGRVKSLFVMN